MNFFSERLHILKLNHQLKKLALSRSDLKEQLRNNSLVIQLPPKKVRELSSQIEKEDLLRQIEQLDGFETLKLCLLENCKPVYKEQLTPFGVARRIEIPLEDRTKYEINFSKMKQLNKNHWQLAQS
ncbi:hypothetical protein SM124_01875 [Bacillus sp. 31A1R]|uniref:Uncharacterized protein n=1 Tax=Robertmurraya mangrovi TaxID=3098077 RepID=A0ABU5ITL5_9BACI|nr:hypothetical protein [Bacillus sp. 31A1R]MDZ5470487.1 hypothetical protein [Bacillus sp. 31A1R]